MKCPICGNNGSRVLDSRPVHDGRAIRRRRECEKCEQRFTTFEMVEEQPLIVIKKDGSREEFSREKLLRGLIRACEKRPVPLAKLESLVAEIESRLRQAGSAEVPSKEIGEMVMERLVDIDEVAYVRFASVYRQFKDINVFVNELEDLLNRSRRALQEEKKRQS
ncbi:MULTISPECIES: transcriptional regulator NrdR [Thermoactinomyces]|uniref:Transcriptional repressor NrdR n=1 Tax=Thermoactinomyces daqus TaxID=1329516 RepID=A0A7W1X7K7_9BACL|nr:MULTISPECIES: transcriptional regulator NrdR [Thermoactinomyces]MBA4541562.1 transcriptional regulator NrdR [Thermoactinomyces daqus]MBH8597558.1 transcriptional regulator NrdR [Thermoactinomyces sp. CICC 10523]MBH8603899.1 transcriptional regulator NrdR [Thermoactinomyces sp. CICC 10522]MBH8606568.1 transcriptional regulator NrdR [Thermoactinomyces sp. CICC 10521]